MRSVREEHVGAERAIRALESLFGAEADEIFVNREWDQAEPELPAVALCTFSATTLGRDFCIYATAGMSSRRPRFPTGWSDRFFRTELLLYTAELSERFHSLLFWLAAFPFIDHKPLAHGHSIRLGEPVFGSDQLRHLLLLTPLLREHRDLETHLVQGDDPVELLWVVPISEAEYQLKVDHGLDELLDLFDERGHPYVFRPDRASYL